MEGGRGCGGTHGPPSAWAQTTGKVLGAGPGGCSRRGWRGRPLEARTCLRASHGFNPVKYVCTRARACDPRSMQMFSLHRTLRLSQSQVVAGWTPSTTAFLIGPQTHSGHTQVTPLAPEPPQALPHLPSTLGSCSAPCPPPPRGWFGAPAAPGPCALGAPLSCFTTTAEWLRPPP